MRDVIIQFTYIFFNNAIAEIVCTLWHYMALGRQELLYWFRPGVHLLVSFL